MGGRRIWKEKRKKFKSPHFAITYLEGCIHTLAEQKLAQVTTHTVRGEVEVLRSYISSRKQKLPTCSYVFV